MSDEDAKLRATLQHSQSQADGAVPGFDEVWAAAQGRVRVVGYKKRIVGLAAAAIVAALAVGLLPSPDEQIQYVDIEELMGSTSWTAPSDFLLPKHQFDIYREIPRLFESTEPYGGTLL